MPRFNPSQTGRYFQERLIAATNVLELIAKRFEINDDEGPEQIYYWLLAIESQAKRIGMELYSRRGRKTLIGLLHADRLWLRSQVYERSLLTVDDLLDSDGRLKPQVLDDQVIDYEHLLDYIELETKTLRDLLQEYSSRETYLIEDFKGRAHQAIHQ